MKLSSTHDADHGPGADWVDALCDAARSASGRAYAPYSRFHVGAAVLADDGRIFAAANVENASYGLGLCAECGLISTLFTTGGGILVAVSCCDRDGNHLMPCGRCRQLLLEHGGPKLDLLTVRGVRPMSEVLPDAFGPENLAQIPDVL